MIERTNGTPWPVYSRAEALADGAVHVAGVTAALLAVPVMITLAAVWHGDAPTVAAASVYGVSLIAMFLASAGYHLVRPSRAKAVLRRLDHAAIFFKIAGTYTPFAVLLAEEHAWAILGGMWTAAVLGAVFKIVAPDRCEWVHIALYLGMGWAVVLIGEPMLARISAPTLVLIVTGGALYSVGVIFHLWERLPFQNAIWHGFVLVASFVFYAAVLIEVAAAGSAP
ncbi:MAG: hemolysin III family protein [Paracoccaceae bacterium]